MSKFNQIPRFYRGIILAKKCKNTPNLGAKVLKSKIFTWKFTFLRGKIWRFRFFPVILHRKSITNKSKQLRIWQTTNLFILSVIMTGRKQITIFIARHWHFLIYTPI